MKLKKEIGSNFAIDKDWLRTSISSTNFLDEGIVVLSGRTAIDIIAQLIPANMTWYLPTYCCDSMIFPIKKHNKLITFYDVAWTNGGFRAEVPLATDKSVIFLCNFFGGGCGFTMEELKGLKERGNIIVYDHTHTAFELDDNVFSIADYRFASLRKWLPIASGAILHLPDSTTIEEMRTYPYTDLQWQGMKLKDDYLNGKLTNKDIFFKYFHQYAEHLLTEYTHYLPDNLSIDYIQKANIKGILQQRNNNADILRNAFKNAPFGTLHHQTTALFFPIFLHNKQRDKLRQHLTANNIYCPIHWPQPELTKHHKGASDIYNSELSIICDQRYNEYDMNYIIQTINHFFITI